MRADAERNRSLIIAAAAALFEENGLDASNRSIARRAGIGIATLQRHFPHREQLVEAVLREQVDSCLAALTRALSINDPREALRSLFEHVLHIRDTRPLVNRALLKTRHHGSPFESERRESRRIVEAVTSRAKAEGRLLPRRDERDVLTAFHSLMSLPRRGYHDGEFAQRLMDILLAGLLTPSSVAA